MYSPEEVKIVHDRKRFPYDLTNAEGKRRFEDYVNKINEQTPGVVATEGQQFDFKKYYAEIGVWFLYLKYQILYYLKSYSTLNPILLYL